MRTFLQNFDIPCTTYSYWHAGPLFWTHIAAIGSGYHHYCCSKFEHPPPTTHTHTHNLFTTKLRSHDTSCSLGEHNIAAFSLVRWHTKSSQMLTTKWRLGNDMNTSYSTRQCSSVSWWFFGWWCGWRCQDLRQEEQPLYDILQPQLSLSKRKQRRLYFHSWLPFFHELLSHDLNQSMCKGFLDLF